MIGMSKDRAEQGQTDIQTDRQDRQIDRLTDRQDIYCLENNRSRYLLFI